MNKSKLFMLEYINMQDDLDYDQKKYIWEFVKYATDVQVEHLFLTENIVSEKEAIKERDALLETPWSPSLIDIPQAVITAFKTLFGANWRSYIPVDIESGAQLGALAAVTGAALAAAIATGSYSVYKTFFSKAEKACRGSEDLAKKVCLMKYKILGKKMQLDKLRKGMAICDKGKKPDVCKAKLNVKISKVVNELKQIQATSPK